MDRFKPLNDCFGHALADKVPALAANRMREIARDTDVIARMGGDDADILLRNADAAMYAAKAEGGDCVRVFAESTVRGAAR